MSKLKTVKQLNLKEFQEHKARDGWCGDVAMIGELTQCAHMAHC